MEILLGIILSISIPFLIKKIKDRPWALKIRYLFRVFLKGIILYILVETFVTTAYSYLVYPKYTATIDGYSEFNSTNEDDHKKKIYRAIYTFTVDGEEHKEANMKTSSSMRPIIGKKTEILYKDGEFMPYNPILFMVLSLVGMGVFYYIVHLIKTDFVNKPLESKESFWGNGTTSYEYSFSFGLGGRDDSSESEEEGKIEPP